MTAFLRADRNGRFGDTSPGPDQTRSDRQTDPVAPIRAEVFVPPTDMEPDGYFLRAKHARRIPNGSALTAPATNGASNGRAAPPQRAMEDERTRPVLSAVSQNGHSRPPDPEDTPEQIPTTAPAAELEVDRVSAMWRARYAIVASTLLVGIAVYFLASAAPAVYSSSATLSITAASTPGGSAQDVALASNSLAAQDALLVTSDSVLAAAAHQLGISPSTLSSHLSSGTLNSQNLIQITAQGPVGNDALRWVQATTSAFQAYLAQRAQSTSTSLRNSITAETESLQQQINELQLVIHNAESAPAGSTAEINLQSYESQLTQLVGTRGSLIANTALAIASQQPVITVIVSGTAPKKVSPRPTLYASVAALLTLLVACQLAVFAARRKQRRPESP